MIDISQTTKAKADQLNADDLVGGPITVKITGVKVVSGDQPVIISYEGDNGKPYKPSKSMRRLMIAMWGKDGQEYVGQKLTLYCDPSVKFGKAEVGGIKISHMSNIHEEKVVMLTSTRGRKAPHKVTPIKEVTEEQKAIQAALQTCAAEQGKEKAVGVLKKMGVEKYTELPPGSLEEVMTLVGEVNE